MDTFLPLIQVIPFGLDEAYHWADLDAQFRKQGNRIEPEDTLMAATALAHELTLVNDGSPSPADMLEATRGMAVERGLADGDGILERMLN